MYNAGQAIGGLSVGYLADKLSRRWTISIAAAFTVLGCILQCAAQHVGMLIAGRAVAGIGCGQILSVVPIYLAEVAPPGQRGFLVGLQGTMISIGFAVSNWIGYACAFAPGNSSWRIALSMQLPVPILLMIELFYVPYSPRWLVQQDRYEEARKVLARLHPTTGDLFAEQELAQITLQIQLEREQGIATWTTSLRQMFSLRYVRRTLLAAFTVSMGQLSGGAVIQNFQVTFYANVGFRGRDALLISGVYGLMSVIGQAIYLWVVADRWPRTKTMIGGSAATSVMLGLCMALSAEYGSATNTNKDGARAAIAAIFLYSIVYSACFNAMVWVVPSELFPFFLRTKGLAFAVMCKSVIAIVLSQISPVALANISWKYVQLRTPTRPELDLTFPRYFSLFIATNGAAALIYFFFLPETVSTFSSTENGSLIRITRLAKRWKRLQPYLVMKSQQKQQTMSRKRCGKSHISRLRLAPISLAPISLATRSLATEDVYYPSSSDLLHYTRQIAFLKLLLCGSELDDRMLQKILKCQSNLEVEGSY